MGKMTMGEMTLKTCHRLMIESITFIRDCDAAAGHPRAAAWRESYAKRLTALKRIEARLSPNAAKPQELN